MILGKKAACKHIIIWSHEIVVSITTMTHFIDPLRETIVGKLPDATRWQHHGVSSKDSSTCSQEALGVKPLSLELDIDNCSIDWATAAPINTPSEATLNLRH